MIYSRSAEYAIRAFVHLAQIPEGKYAMVDIPDPKLGPRTVDVANMYNTERYRPNYSNKTGLPIFLTRAS